MLVWLNGTFGVGKTTTAEMIGRRSNIWRPFDPEWVGYMLRANLPDRELGDFQHLPAWRRLVPVVAREVADYTAQNLIAVQSVLIEEYWQEMRTGLAMQGLEVFHVVLDASEEALRQRISGDEEMRTAIETGAVDPGAERWRLDHLVAYRSARPWMTAAADLVVDTTELTADQVASRVLEAM